MNFLIYSDQYPFIKQRLKKILKERIGEPSDFNVINFDLNESKDIYQEAITEIMSVPMMFDRKAVVIDNANFINNDKKIDKEFSDALIDDDLIDVIFIIREDKCNLNSLTYQKVNETGKVIRVAINKEEWPTFVKKYFNDRGVQIEFNAIQELIKRTGMNLSLFIQEANKLVLYTKKVTLLDVTRMVSKPLEDNAYELSNALMKKNNALALDIYRDLKLQGTKMADSLIPMLANQFRNINKVRFLAAKGYSNNEITSILGLKSEWQVKIANDNARRFSASVIANALNDLYELDKNSKSGLIDRNYGFELFLINFPNTK